MTERFISRRRRRSPGLIAAVLGVVIGVGAAFLVGFALFYALGNRAAGGDLVFELPGWGGSPSASADPSVPAPTKREVPLPSVDLIALRDATYVPVKGIYLSSWAAGSSELFPAQLALADRTEINAMVIDVKDATGYVSYDSDIPMVDELDLEELRIRDLDALMQTLNEHDIFPIARIVCFNDPLLSTRNTDLAVMDKDGGIWKDDKGSSYTNPYDRRVWEYLVDLGEEAADHGFREIQFDYVRFPSDGKISDTVYPGADRPKEDLIASFLAYARSRLEPKGVWVSADVFGLTVHVKDDLGIGQRIEKLSRQVDIVCPMIYPSHYYSGVYNIDNPNANPHDTITAAMADSGVRLRGSGAIVRPWLQDFSLGGVTYDAQKVKAQIDAVEAQGYNEWLLWDPSVKYQEGALRPAGSS
jgi:hypothetical protein